MLKNFIAQVAHNSNAALDQAVSTVKDVAAQQRTLLDKGLGLTADKTAFAACFAVADAANKAWETSALATLEASRAGLKASLRLAA